MVSSISTGERFYGFGTPPEDTRLGKAAERTKAFEEGPNRSVRPRKKDRTWHKSHNPGLQGKRDEKARETKKGTKQDGGILQEHVNVAMQEWLSIELPNGNTVEKGMEETNLTVEELMAWWSETQGETSFGEWGVQKKNEIGNTWAESPAAREALEDYQRERRERDFSRGGADNLARPNRIVSLIS